MSWKSYNEVIAALRADFGLTLEEAQERYREMAEELGHPPTVDDLEREELPSFDDFDVWEDAYDSGEFDDYPYEEADGGINTGKGKK